MVNKNTCPKCQSTIRYLKHSVLCKCGSKFIQRKNQISKNEDRTA